MLTDTNLVYREHFSESEVMPLASQKEAIFRHVCACQNRGATPPDDPIWNWNRSPKY